MSTAGMADKAKPVLELDRVGIEAAQDKPGPVMDETLPAYGERCEEYRRGPMNGKRLPSGHPWRLYPDFVLDRHSMTRTSTRSAVDVAGCPAGIAHLLPDGR